MADETKETSVAETASETPKKKRDWKGKRLPIVIAAVVAVTVLGVAGWAWRATPGYCDALCHSTMGKTTTRSRIRLIPWRSLTRVL
ncbi:MAG: hypothetical protein ACLVHL_01220 [Collinsella intestinalis]